VARRHQGPLLKRYQKGDRLLSGFTPWGRK